MPTACPVVAPVLAGTHAFEEVHAVAPHQPERLKKLVGATPAADDLAHEIPDLQDGLDALLWDLPARR